MKLTIPIVLASRSPRRRMLLEQLGVNFVVQDSQTDETYAGELKPELLVKTLALRKAQAVADFHGEALILAADTVVYHDESIIEKPKDPDDAKEMLNRLSGDVHHVYTGIALIHPPSDRTVQAVESTAVQMATLKDDEIGSYVQTGAPMDKAGGYGIQDTWGAIFVEKIDGDYNTVVGLPLQRLYQVLRSDFSDLLDL